MSLVNKKYFYVRPTNSVLLESCNTVERVSIDKIKNLACFAVSLKETINVFNPLDYLTLLADFYGNNDNDLSDTYRKLSVSHFGMNFLCTCIKMVILEVLFRETGIDEQLAQAYNSELTDYNGQLELNDAMFTVQVQEDDEFAYAKAVYRKMGN